MPEEAQPEEEKPQKVTGLMMQSFCPKRFNRFPRFSATQNNQSLQNPKERTVSLNYELLGLDIALG